MKHPATASAVIFALLALPIIVGTPARAQQPANATAPVDASNRTEDIRVTDQIRTALAADGTLAATSRNVDITTNAQAVILRGAVASVEDKTRIETVAGQYAGVRQIESELTIQDNGTQPAHHLAPPAPRA